MDATSWIIVVVLAVLVVVGVLTLVLRNRRHTRLHGEAVRIREKVEQQSVQVDRRAALAEETAAKARAARAEAEAKVAEATRLEQRAEAHHQAAAEGREELDARLEHADHIDPRVREMKGEAVSTPMERATDDPRR
jgi:biopolymer transport protein ExbB/TolQ